MPMAMMQMYFHFRLNEYLLFREWLPQNVPAYLISLLAVFAISAFYEGLRVGRALLFRRQEDSEKEPEQQAQCCSAPNAQPQQQQQHEQQRGLTSSCDCAPPQVFYGAPVSSSNSLLSGWHIFQSLLHFIQFMIGFSLMLLAMTYNVPVFLALLFGHAFGYFLARPLYRHGLAEEGRVGGECCCS